MDKLSKILEILLKRMPYEPFLKNELDCMAVDKKIMNKSIHSYLPNYTDTEVFNTVESLIDSLGNYAEFFELGLRKGTGGVSVFDAVLRFAESMLVKQNNEVLCRYESILGWRKTTSDISEEIFVAAFLARRDLENGTERRIFTWPPVISHNNMQLRNLSKKGMAENHFHLWGSAPCFHIAWIRLMNDVTNRRYIRQLDRMDENIRTGYITYDKRYPEKNLSGCYLQAALIRLFLFAVLTERKIQLGEYYVESNILEPWIHKFSGNRGKNAADKDKNQRDSDQKRIRLRDVRFLLPKEVYERLWWEATWQKVKYFLHDIEAFERHADQIQAVIDSFSGEYYGTIDDYALLARSFTSYKDEESYLVLSGERWLLYEMFRRVICGSKKLPYYIYNLFYAYLIIKEKIRGELVQSNEWIGFENFQVYQDRKALFTEGAKYDKLLARMAVMSCVAQNVRLLELRITPGQSCEKNYNNIRFLDQAIDPDKKMRDRFFYVFHFIKQPDNQSEIGMFCEYRHYALRQDIRKKAQALIEFRKRYPIEASRVLGIDAASQEIGCRPEVFATIFRTLKREANSMYTIEGKRRMPQLCATYHVGEDFLDVADGLRAIAEAVLFLELDCGDRLGHALALGISVREWYQSKQYHISLPKQDYLDNLVWLYFTISRYHIYCMDNLKNTIESAFRKYFSEIYGKYMDQNYLEAILRASGKKNKAVGRNLVFDIHAYYDAWKLRGDDPQLYEKGYFEKRNEKFTPFEVNAVNSGFPRDFNIREVPEAAIIYHLYHYDENVRREGKKEIDIKVTEDYIKGVELVQKAMQREVAMRGIAIETNPSSNCMIGTFKRYDEHPIIKFYNKELTLDTKALEESPQIWVSVNTDDQGIFGVKLENEYALLARALEKKQDEEGEPVYQKAKIYEWLDKIREMSLSQSFGNNAFIPPEKVQI